MIKIIGSLIIVTIPIMIKAKTMGQITTSPTRVYKVVSEMNLTSSVKFPFTRGGKEEITSPYGVIKEEIPELAALTTYLPFSTARHLACELC